MQFLFYTGTFESSLQTTWLFEYRLLFLTRSGSSAWRSRSCRIVGLWEKWFLLVDTDLRFLLVVSASTQSRFLLIVAAGTIPDLFHYLLFL
jgi:hypothetical protein